MSLSKSKSGEIPSDAVILTEEEAFIYQWKIIEKWPKMSEVWSLRFAPGILGALSAVTGSYINHHYRKKLKLGSYGSVSTYLPAVVLPTLMSLLCHKTFVQREIVLKGNVCPICYELRATTIQLGFSLLYPIIFTPFSSFMFATRHYTYNVPSITQNPKEVLSLIRKFTKPLGPFIIGTGISYAVITMFLVHKQIEQIWKLEKHLQEVDKTLN